MTHVWLGQRKGNQPGRSSVEERCARRPGYEVIGRDRKHYVTLGPATATHTAPKLDQGAK